MTTFTITDDSGFLGIVNADEYSGFVSENWELPQLIDHFVDQMNEDNLILWSTGAENLLTVAFVKNASNYKAFREFSKTITVTCRRVFLTNYEDLTVAAQHEDQKIPADHNADLLFELENGRHEFLIRQLFNPEDDNYELEGKVHFEVVVQHHANTNSQHVDGIFWGA